MKFTNSPYETKMQQVPRYERPEPVKAPEGSRCHGSPYETMMQQVPRYERPEPVKAPEGSRCHGCPYWRGIGCVACYRELLKGAGGGR